MAALQIAFGTTDAWRRRVPLVAIAVAGALCASGLPAVATPPTPAAPTVEENATSSEPLTAPDAVSAAAIARLEGRPVEVLAERTESSSVFVLPDGTKASGMGAGPVWVRQGGDGTRDEDWAQVDLSLHVAEDGSVRPVAHSGDLVLAGATDAPADGAPVDLATVTDPATGVSTSVQWDGALPEPQLSGRRATYADVQPGVDLVLEATSTGFQEFFVVEERPQPGADLTFPLTVTAEGAALQTAEDGAIEVVASGEVVAKAAEPMMWDADSDQGRAFPITQARPNEAEDTQVLSPMPAWVLEPDHGAASSDTDSVARAAAEAETAAPVEPVGDLTIDPLAQAVEVERTISQPTTDVAEVALAPQEEFLQDPETVYPVVIDPDINLNWGFDTYVLKGYSDNRSEEYELRAGTYNGGTNVARSYIHFPMGQFAGATVTNARLELFNYYSWSCQARNWQVWNVYAASAASTWANMPGWATHYATSSETHGYSSACGGAWSNANITSFAQMWAATNETEGHVGIKAESETDNYGWKRFYSSNNGSYIPSIWVTYNHTPNAPTGLTVSNATTSGATGTWTNVATPTLSATLTDRNGGTVNGNFTVKRADNGTTVYSGAANGLLSGAVGSVKTSALADGQKYTVTARVSDNIVEGPPASLTFGVDTTKPLAPRITSTDYPDDNTWHGAENTAGNFTITPAAIDGSLTTYIWGLDKVPDPAQKVTASATGAASKLTVTPTTAGRHVLQLQALDRAGNASGVLKYAFNVGRAGIVTPDDGSRVVRRTRLHVTGEDVFTYVKFQWRRGPDSPAADIKNIPTAQLQTSTGVSWQDVATGGWAPLPRGNSAYTAWDVGATLGSVGGPIQVRAVTATSSAGAGAYNTGWITLTVDSDASGAATAEIGPGNVNLLTGEHTLSVTDVEEFGLSVVRTASSRDTDSGYELQADKVTQAHSEATSITGVVAGNSTVSVDTTRFHDGTSSFKVTPNGTSVDSYIALGADGGSMALGMLPGRTYRVSTWVYVPSATTLTPGSPRGLSLQLFSRTGAAAWAEPSTRGAASAKPTMTNAWQQLSMDVTIPAGTTEAFLRLYNGNSAAAKPVYFDDITVNELWAPFGKQWASGTTDSSAGTAYTRISRPYPDVAAVHLTGGGEIWFTSGDGQKWWPEPGAQDLSLKAVSATSWRLTEIDGTTTDFAKNGGSGDFPVTVSTAPAASGAARHVYDTSFPGQSRLIRIIAPIEDGVDGWPANAQACNPTGNTPPARGCEVLDIKYAITSTANATTNGNVAGQVESMSLWGTDPATGVVASVPVARYLYDGSGRLVKVWDPRIGSSTSSGPGPGALVTSYTYDTATGRLTSAAAPGEEAYRFEYGRAGGTTSGAGDFIDASSGRLLTVTRRSLVEGTTGTWGPDNISRVVYDVPLTRSAGGPYDLDPASLASWAQQNGPTDATAVFGPQDEVPVSTATSTIPGADGYRGATVHYLDASGLEVNTATPAGADAPVEGYIDTTEYDNQGKVVRTLDATNRLLALGKLEESADVASWGLPSTDSSYVAQLVDSRTTYTQDGLDVVSERGPAQRLALANDANAVVTMHAITRYSYDEGAPDGMKYHLPTTVTAGGLLVGADIDGGAVQDPVVTVNDYNPVDGSAALSPQSGWVHKQPTRVIVNPGRADELRSSVLYDPFGRPLKSVKPGSSGNDAATTLTVLYSASPNASEPACGGRPEWAGQPCVTRAAGAVTGHDASRMSTVLPEKRVLGYNRFGSPTVVTETASGPVDGSVASVTRTTTTTYDAADRVIAVAVSATGGAAGTAIERTGTVYDALTGDVLETTSLDSNGAVTASIRRSFDELGRLTSYTDADGATTTTTYDRFGATTASTQVIAGRTLTTTYEYDREIEPRGFVTSVTDPVAGEISATWGPDGQMESEILPGGIELEIDYDAARVPVSRTYRKLAQPFSEDQASNIIWADTVVENHRGQWIRHEASTGTLNYAYDGLGRLITVNDTEAATASCTTRVYGFAGSDRSTRTQFATATGDPGATCPTATPETIVAYDSADRLQGIAGQDAQWSYDPFGRVTALPIGSALLRNEFYVNDLVRSQTIEGESRQTWSLDPTQRRTTMLREKWNGGSWVEEITSTSHYANDSDEPTWIAEDATLATDVTRMVSGLEGDLAVTTDLEGGRVIQLVDLHGDVVGTVPVADGAAAATWSEIRFMRSDEFGNPLPMSGAADANSPPARYGWLGAAQRSSEALGGVILMGVRLYLPAAGLFLSPDPVAGGSANAYDYCNADPVNCTDLDGTFSFKSIISAVAVVGEVASLVPGPIGAAAAGISAVAYAAKGDRSKALEMGVTAVAQLVGAGPVVRVAARVVSTARATGQVAMRAAPRVARAAAGRAANIARRTCNSFVPGTLVTMADGSLVPIESVQAGDLVLTQDPETGARGSQPVLTPIVGVGTKHLIAVQTEGSSWIATAFHPVWVNETGWVDSEDLRVGDHLRTEQGNATPVIAVQDLGALDAQTVFNLAVSDDHTFFVQGPNSNESVLVHNARSCGIAKFDVPKKSGIYILHYSDGRAPYVGRSVNMHRRVHRHAATSRGGFTRVEVRRVRAPWLPVAELAQWRRLGGAAGTSNKIRPSIPRAR
ncbi:DNRLRE domain-containing protein [Cellulomonas sp. PS-H5]|uniref:DNRLRE domain-containing protein n=1 Tax=Cellulomonas sp. PS-H5 TaxID=2820400 RepID=UPI001C4E6B9C|nr:DNRLRE domain-containing protein [Cellulomonas sp. PS-H5]MBW0254839.1 DNRLRE domain-containing protein [Cellulomonas sp. PS-H5]